MRFHFTGRGAEFLKRIPAVYRRGPVFLVLAALLAGCGPIARAPGSPSVRSVAWGRQVSGLTGLTPGQPWYGFGPGGHHLILLANGGIWQLSPATGTVALLRRLTSPGMRGLLGINSRGIFFTQDSYRSPQPYTRVMVLPRSGGPPVIVASTPSATPVNGPLWHGEAQGCGTLDPRNGTWLVPPLPPGIASLSYCQPQTAGTALAFAYGGSAWAALVRHQGQALVPLPLDSSVFRVNPFASPGPDVVLGVVGAGGAIPDGMQAFGSIPEANNLLLFDAQGKPLGATTFRSRFIGNWWTGPGGTIYFSMAHTSGFNPRTGTARTGTPYLGLLLPDGSVQVLGPAAAYAHPTLPPSTRRQFLLYLLARGQLGVAVAARGGAGGPVPWRGGFVYAAETSGGRSFGLFWWRQGKSRLLGRFPGSSPGPFAFHPPYLAFPDGAHGNALAVVRLP